MIIKVVNVTENAINIAATLVATFFAKKEIKKWHKRNL